MSSVSGKVNVSAAISPTVIRQRVDNEGLNPYQSITVHTEKYISRNGFPVVPKLWAAARTYGSTEGVAVSGDRISPTELVTGADLRFVAGEDSWDSAGGVWRPEVGSGGLFRSHLATRPFVRSVEYIVGREMIIRSAMRISAGTFLYSDMPNHYFNECTVSLVLALGATNSSYPVFDYYDPEHPTELPSKGNRTALIVTDKIDYLWNTTGGSVDPLVPLANARPIFITLTYTRGTVRCYVSYSHRHNFTTSKSGSSFTPPLKIALGGSYLGAQPTNMDVFEFGWWSVPLTQDEAKSLHAQYISSYGVGSDWS